MPTVLLRSMGDGEGEEGLGTGGAFWRSHFRCVMAPLRRSRKIFSPPLRKEILMLSGEPIPGALRPWSMGPGDSVRGLAGSRPLGMSCESNGAPHSSQESSHG